MNGMVLTATMCVALPPVLHLHLHGDIVHDFLDASPEEAHPVAALRQLKSEVLVPGQYPTNREAYGGTATGQGRDKQTHVVWSNAGSASA